MKRLLAILFLLVTTALAQATTVSSITCAGQTATVNSTAHGLVASQGFSLSGTSPTFNSTTATVTANSFTFILPATNPCSGFTSGYTAVAPAKQIIELSSVANPMPATVTMNYLFWFTTMYPNPLPANTQSAWSGASSAETAAIVAGTTVETVGQMTVGAAMPAASVTSQIVSQYNAMQTGFAGYLLAGGYYWNGVSWIHQ
jgi:hypothetical protein